MIRSMTGFGRAVQEIDGYVITVELKSVNHRYFEFSSRVPRQYGFIEDKLKSFVNSRVSRGKVDCFVGIEALNTEAAQVAVNHTLAGAYNTALQEIADTYGAKQDWGAAAIARFPDVLVVRKAEEDEDKIWYYVQTVAAAALDKFVAMREVEGAKMKADVESRLCFLEERVGRVETLSAGRVEAYTARLYEKLKTILEDRSIDDARVLTEAAIFGDKTAVDEETVRLRSHIAQYRSILELDEPVGRKLDFLTQELNRETNTIGSKCQDLDITRTVVDMKAEIEKIREQIQNLE